MAPFDDQTNASTIANDENNMADTPSQNQNKKRGITQDFKEEMALKAGFSPQEAKQLTDDFPQGNITGWLRQFARMCGFHDQSQKKEIADLKAEKEKLTNRVTEVMADKQEHIEVRKEISAHTKDVFTRANEVDSENRRLKDQMRLLSHTA